MPDATARDYESVSNNRVTDIARTYKAKRFGHKSPDPEEPSDDEAPKNSFDLRDTTMLSVDGIFLDKHGSNVSEQHLLAAVSYNLNERYVGQGIT
jgi:hypothetical protein